MTTTTTTPRPGLIPQIRQDGDRLTVTAFYNTVFVKTARDVGGSFADGVGSFDLRDALPYNRAIPASVHPSPSLGVSLLVPADVTAEPNAGAMLCCFPGASCQVAAIRTGQRQWPRAWRR